MHTDLPPMTNGAQATISELDKPAPAKPEVSKEDKKRRAQLKQEVDTCRAYRRKLVRNWTVNIDMRRGKPFGSQVDDDSVQVNMDWPLTKTKTAALFSQVPQARVNHHPDSAQAGPWLAAFERKLNDTLIAAGIEAAMEECLPDCINAAGFGAVIVSYEAIMADKEVPAIDVSILPPELQAMFMQSGEMPMETVPTPISTRYLVQRISPSDLLWPVEFTGSDFDQAPWIGRTGRVTKAEAIQRFGVTEEEIESMLGEDQQVQDRLTHDADREKIGSDKVGFDEIFYREFCYDPKAKSFDSIHHIVFLHGKDEPVIDEPWKGQKYDEETSRVFGVLDFPIRVLTISYLTDEAIPPSDTAIGRPQVNELNRGRTNQIRQRERSLPLIWFDVNRLDPAIQSSLLQGRWQHMLPVQGDGSRVLGALERAHMSQENFTFDEVAKRDLYESWAAGPNQTGAGADVETKGEAGVLQSNFQTKVTKERARVASFFAGIAQVVGGLLCLMEDPAAFGEGFAPEFSTALNVSILPDSTIILDSNQRIERLTEFVNVFAKTGWVNLDPILKEIASLVGLDPNLAIKAPEPKVPMEPNISLRLSGSEDMMNPLTLAFLIKSGQAPPPELIDQAKQLIQSAVVTPPAPPPTGEEMGMPEAAPPAIGDANPDATILPTIAKRSDDPASMGGQ